MIAGDCALCGRFEEESLICRMSRIIVCGADELLDVDWTAVTVVFVLSLCGKTVFPTAVFASLVKARLTGGKIGKLAGASTCACSILTSVLAGPCTAKLGFPAGRGRAGFVLVGLITCK